MNDDDWTGAFGPIDLPALQRIRNLWIDLEPLVTGTELDDVINPTVLSLHLDDGIASATEARIDCRWSKRGMYSFHYVDSAGVNWRFDRHPNTHSALAHFHRPPDCTPVEPSIIEVREVSLVTRAVVVLWRQAYESSDLDRLNCGLDPP